MEAVTPPVWALAVLAGVVALFALAVTIYACWVRKTTAQGRSVDSLMKGYLVVSAALVGIVVTVTAVGIMIVT